MYTSYFGFSQQPFTNADSRLLLQRPQVAAIYERLSRGLEQGWGLLLTGPAGTGKSALLRRLRTDIQGRVHCVALWNAHLEWPDLLAYLAEQLGAPEPVAPEKLAALVGYQPLVVMIADAQQLPDSSLTGLGRLLQPDADARPPLSLVLAGPPELERRLADNPELAARVALHCHLEPWSREEMKDYVRVRLVEAGREDGLDLFEPEALDKGLDLAEGLPRRADLIFNQALLLSYLNSEQRVPARFVRRVAEARPPPPQAGASPLEGDEAAVQPPPAAPPPAVVETPPASPADDTLTGEPSHPEPPPAGPPPTTPLGSDPAPMGSPESQPPKAVPAAEPETPVPLTKTEAPPQPQSPEPAALPSSQDPFAPRRAPAHRPATARSRRRPRRRFGIALTLLLLILGGGVATAWYLELPLDPRRIDWTRTLALLEQLPGLDPETATPPPGSDTPPAPEPPPVGATVEESDYWPSTDAPQPVGEPVREPGATGDITLQTQAGTPSSPQPAEEPADPPQEEMAERFTTVEPTPPADEAEATSPLPDEAGTGQSAPAPIGPETVPAQTEPPPAGPETAAAQTPPRPAQPEPEVEAAGIPPGEAQPAPLTAEQTKTVEQLLASARQQMSALRYTIPAGDNALESYRQVLDIDPDNTDARAGIESIKTDFLRWAESARQRGETAKARRHLETALAIDPEDDTVRARLEDLE